ncbi:MAG: sigma-70 family RNA polymerase sigma factor [Acidobacteriota bacterium]
MMERNEEQALIARWTRGERRAAEQLVDQTYGQTFAALVKMTGGDRELAADLTQETYRRAFKGFASFDGRARFATWLYRIAYTTFLNHVRRPKPVDPLEPEQAERLVSSADDPEASLSQRRRAARLRRAVIDLPEDLRFTLSAYYWADMEVKDIAQLEGVTGAAIRKRLKTARERLRGVLEEGAAA